MVHNITQRDIRIDVFLILPKFYSFVLVQNIYSLDYVQLNLLVDEVHIYFFRKFCRVLLGEVHLLQIEVTVHN